MDANTTPYFAAATSPPDAVPEFDPRCAARWRRRGGGTPTGDWGVPDQAPPDPPGSPHLDSQALAGEASPDDLPECAPRDAELWLLARRSQGAALRLVFELRTALARQLFRRDFVHVSRQLHGLEASRRVQGLDRACLDDALAAVQRRADDVQALLAGIATELQSAIAARAPADTRLAFACPARFQATITSPGAHRYLALLTQADDTLARLEMAWLLGLVDPAHRSALASDCRRALNGFKDLAADRRQAIGTLVREVNAQRRGVASDGRDASDEIEPR